MAAKATRMQRPTGMYTKGQQVIERTGLGAFRQDREVTVADVGPMHVTTSTGLLYTRHGMSASRTDYRSIRSMAYAEAKRPSDAMGT